MIRGLKAVCLAAFVVSGLGGCGEAVTNSPVAVEGQFCQANFNTCVMPVLTQGIRNVARDVKSCANVGCHHCDDTRVPGCLAGAANGGRLTLNPIDSTLSMQAVAQPDFYSFPDVENSTLLTRPLAGDVAFHGGNDIFPTNNDPCYRVIRTWLSQQVTDQSDARCNSCVQVVNIGTDCGYPP